MSASRALTLALLLVIIHAPSISARGRGGGHFGGGGSIHVSLNLDPIDWVTFSSYIIFAVLTMLQALQGLGALGRTRRAEEDFHRRVPFILLTLLAILSLLTTYSLGAVIESQTNEITLQSFNFVVASAMLSFVRAFTHISLYAALVLLLDYRNTIQALQYGHSKSKNFVIAFRVVSVALLFIMFSCVLARAIIGSTQPMGYNYGEQPPLAARAYGALYHLFIACYIVVTAIICGTSIILWMNKRPMDSQPHWLLFDANVRIFFLPNRLSLF